MFIIIFIIAFVVSIIAVVEICKKEYVNAIIAAIFSILFDSYQCGTISVFAERCILKCIAFVFVF